MTEITYQEECKRKLIHLSSLWMVAAILLVPGRLTMGIVFAVMLVLNLICERAYIKNWPLLGALYGKLFQKMLRQPTASTQYVVSGSPYVLAAAAVSCFCFAPAAAAGGLIVMLLGDTAAALVGRQWGKHPAPNHKSWEGFAAFLLAGWLGVTVLGLIIGAPYGFYWGGIIGAIPAAFAELFEKQLHLDDNFSIPLIVGTILQLTFRIIS